jgi:hypothetical protein
LIKKVEEVLIRDQLETIYIEAKTLLRDERHQGKDSWKFSKDIYSNSLIDLALLFKLVSRVPNATLELKKIVENHIYEMGMNAIECISGTAINVWLILVL